MRFIALLLPLFLQSATADPAVEPAADVGNDFQYCRAPGVLNISSWAENRSNNHWQPPADWTDITKHSPESLKNACTAYFERGDFYVARSWQIKLAAWLGNKKWEQANNLGKGCCEECKGFWQHGFLFTRKRECKSGLTCHGGYCIAQNVVQALLRGTKNVLLSPKVAVGAVAVIAGGAAIAAAGGAAIVAAAAEAEAEAVFAAWQLARVETAAATAAVEAASADAAGGGAAAAIAALRAAEAREAAALARVAALANALGRNLAAAR